MQKGIVMARTKSDVRETVVAKLVDVFYEHGFDGTSLSIISERTGLQRASLYHHFPGVKRKWLRP
jgi:TetR/AcrR family transcriptional regulator, lmrAB and yxaGH operons repressor